MDVLWRKQRYDSNSITANRFYTYDWVVLTCHDFLQNYRIWVDVLCKRDSVNDLSSHCPQGLIFCHGVVLWQLDYKNCRHMKENWAQNELEKILSWQKNVWLWFILTLNQQWDIVFWLCLYFMTSCLLSRFIWSAFCPLTSCVHDEFPALLPSDL